MTTKEKIIYATLNIASIKGLANTSLSDIAKEVGITKASIYSHFSSREEIIKALYSYLRKKTKEKSHPEINLKALVKSYDPTILLEKVAYDYMNMNSESNMDKFYKIIVSEQLFSREAGEIILEETELMLLKTKELLREMDSQHKLKIKDITTASYIFAYTIHQMIHELSLRRLYAKEPDSYELEVRKFIKGYVNQYSA